MQRALIITIPDMPRFEQTQGFEIFINTLKKECTIEKYFSTKDRWNILFVGKIKNIEELLNNHQWSHNIIFKNKDKIYNCSRPIVSIEILGNDSMPEKPRYPNINYGSTEEKQIFFRQLENGELIKVPLKSNNLPKDLLKCFLWKEHLAFYEKNHGILWIKPGISPKKFTKALNAKILDCEEMFARDLQKDYKKIFNERKYYFLSGEEFLQYMKIICKKIITINNLDINENYLNLLIDHYKLDKNSETIGEFPQLEGIVSAKLYNLPELYNKEDSLCKKVIYIGETIVMINQMSKENLLVSSSSDPFGIRGRINKIKPWRIKWIEIIEEGYIKQWIYKRIEKQLPTHMNIMNLSLEDKYFYSHISIDLSLIKRLKKLVAEECNISKELSIMELKLLTDINNSTVNDIPKLTEELINYINNYQIIPYIERKNIITTFLHKFFI